MPQLPPRPPGNVNVYTATHDPMTAPAVAGPLIAPANKYDEFVPTPGSGSSSTMMRESSIMYAMGYVETYDSSGIRKLLIVTRIVCDTLIAPAQLNAIGMVHV